MLPSQSSDPDVVLRNGPAPTTQALFDVTVVLRRFRSAVKDTATRCKLLDTADIGRHAAGLPRAIVQLTEHNRRYEDVGRLAKPRFDAFGAGEQGNHRV